MRGDSWRSNVVMPAIPPLAAPSNPDAWLKPLAQVQWEYLPIVDVHRGLSLGCEARGLSTPGAGGSIRQLFADADRDAISAWLFTELAARTIERFAKLFAGAHLKLFIGAELRLLSPELIERTAAAMLHADLPDGSVCFGADRQY